MRFERACKTRYGLDVLMGRLDILLFVNSLVIFTRKHISFVEIVTFMRING